MSHLDSFLGDLLQDNFHTGDDFGSDPSGGFDSLFNDAEQNFLFDGLANDPILGNIAMSKKAEIVTVPVPAQPLAALSPVVQIKFEPAPELNLNQAPAPVMPVSPTSWIPQQPTAPFVFGGQNAPPATAPFAAHHARAMPAPVQPNPFLFRQLAPVPPVQPQVDLQKQFRRMVDMKEQDEEDKKEKKRLAVRKCREKKRKELKELESRAGTFDEEITELRRQLKRARTEGRVVENLPKNLANVQALMSAIGQQDAELVSQIANTLVAAECNATTPCSSSEAIGKGAVVEHFKALSSLFDISNFSTSFAFDSSSQAIIRCKFSTEVRQIAAAFGIHTSPEGGKAIALDGGCRFTFNEGMLVDVSCTWDHSALLLQLLGIPSLQH
jgi:hypothetical protein